MRVGVLGGGALGLTAALRLAQRGVEVHLLERDTTLGGLVASFQVGGSYLERFYHHLFRSDKVITGLIQELGLGPKLVWIRPQTSILYQGCIYPFDSARGVLSFNPLSILDRLRMGAVVAYLRLERNYAKFEGMEASRWIRKWMGESAYRVIWGVLLRAKFGPYAERIAMPWFWSRVHVRSPALGYLRGGFFQLYQTLGAHVEALGGKTSTGQEVKEIRRSGESIVVATPSMELSFDKVIATFPTRLFMRLTPELPEDYRRRYDWGDHYGAHCVILVLNQSLTGVYWLNINDPGYPFLNIIEHTNFMPPEDYGGKRLLYLGNYLPMDHPLFKLSDQEVLDQFLPHLKKVNPRFTTDWVEEAFVFKAPYAQPVVTVDYMEHLPPHETPIPNLYLANMSQVYPQDRGQNYSMALAERVVALALGQG